MIKNGFSRFTLKGDDMYYRAWPIIINSIYFEKKSVLGRKSLYRKIDEILKLPAIEIPIKKCRKIKNIEIS